MKRWEIVLSYNKNIVSNDSYLLFVYSSSNLKGGSVGSIAFIDEKYSIDIPTALGRINKNLSCDNIEDAKKDFAYEYSMWLECYQDNLFHMSRHYQKRDISIIH